MFFRKAGLPILMVRFPDGTDVPYWNTFYQEVIYNQINPLELVRQLNMQYQTAVEIADTVNKALANKVSVNDIDFGRWAEYREQILEYLQANRSYLGQMDLNIKSPLVWDYYRSVLKKLSDYGVAIVRLDAFAYAPKEPGLRNFLNDPGTWDLLQKIDYIAGEYGLTLLPEIHAGMDLRQQGQSVFPGNVIDLLQQIPGSRIIKEIS